MPKPLKYSGARQEKYETLRASKAYLDKATYNRSIGQLNRSERIAREKASIKQHNIEAREHNRIIAEQVAEVRGKRAIQFSKLQDAVLTRRNKVKASKTNPWKPFTLVMTSAVNKKVKLEINFKGNEHFLHWLEAIENQNVVADSENYQKYVDKIESLRNVFDNVTFTIKPVKAGCNKKKEETVVKETPFYTLTLHSPPSHGNNCGLKCLENILEIGFSYCEIRQKFNIPLNTAIAIDDLMEIYKSYNRSKMLCIIDDQFNDEFNEDWYYIFVKNGHYYNVLKHVYKGHNDKKTKRGFLFWDLETRPTETFVLVGNQKSFLLKDTICRAVYYDYKSEEQKSLCFETTKHKTASRQFLDWLSIQSNNGKTYNCFAHNASRFDHYFLLSEFTKQEQLHSDTQLRGYSMIGIQFKSHLFKDTCCYLTSSLSNLCKSFKVLQAKKTTFEFKGEMLTNENICFYNVVKGKTTKFWDFMALKQTEPEFWEMYSDYCLYDCISLAEVWFKFMREYDVLNKKIFADCPELMSKTQLMGSNTIGSLAKKLLDTSVLERNPKDPKKHVKSKAYSAYLRFVQEWIEPEGNEKGHFETDEEKVAFINKFKRGGISHCNQPGKYECDIMSVDISSQYPASMMNMHIPVGPSVWDKPYSEFRHGFYHLKDLVFSSSKKFKPVSIKIVGQSLNWNTTQNMNEAFVDSFMILYLKKFYGLESFQVVRSLTSLSFINGSELFGKFVEPLYAEKMNQDKLKDSCDVAYNPALRETIKLFLNSLSGKLVEDPSRYFSLKYTLDDTKQKNKVNLNGISAVKEVQGKSNTWVNAGVMVYSYSKRLLFEYIHRLPNGSDDVIHVETDSIYFLKKHDEELRKNLDNYTPFSKEVFPVGFGNALGNIKVEKDTSQLPNDQSHTSYFLGKKFYYIPQGNCIKIKGQPVKTIDTDGNTIININKQFFENAFLGQSQQMSFSSLKKNLFGAKVAFDDQGSKIVNTFISTHTATRTTKPAENNYIVYN